MRRRAKPDADPRQETRMPIIRGRLVYLRPGERTDIPLFVRWLSDARTTRVPRAPQPDRPGDGGALVRGHARPPRARPLVLRDLPASRTIGPVGSIDLHVLDLTNGSAGLGILIGDPADTSQGYGSRCDPRAARLRVRGAAPRADLARRVRRQRAGPPRVRAARLRPRGDVPAGAYSGTAATSTSIGWRCSATSGRTAARARPA